MTRMTIEQVQRVSLDILRHIDEFCKAKGITYFLDAGTLIGAMRHGGFIPWDDDADVLMPRYDYDRFVREYTDGGNYRLYDPSRGNSYLPYARLCEMSKTFFGQHLPWTNESPGVGVDVFPLDGAPASKDQYDEIAQSMTRLECQLYVLRSSLSNKFTFRKNPWGFAKDIVHALARLWRRIFFKSRFDKVMSEINRLRLQNDYRASSKCFSHVVSHRQTRYWEKKYFAKEKRVLFCGGQFPVPEEYDKRLNAEYGDWRTPPTDVKHENHSSFQTMYWRDK